MFNIVKRVARYCEMEDEFEYTYFDIGTFKYFGDAFKAMIYFTNNEEHMEYYGDMLKDINKYGTHTGFLTKKGNSDITYCIEKI